MKLTIIYDNEVYKKDMGLKSDWGFSCLIETKDENILFDVGAKGKILLDNMQKLGVKPQDVSKIVISHEHWDHNGGLKSLVPFVNNLELYRLESSKTFEKIKTIIVKSPQMIAKNVYSTGRLEGVPVDEQSLIFKGKKSWYVLAGCSHSGVENILQIAKKSGTVVGIIGGLHGFNNFSVLDDLDIVCPCHCTKYKKQMLETYPTKFFEGGVGRVIDI